MIVKTPTRHLRRSLHDQPASYVLVGGWPGSGKSTVARALADELGAPVLCKDELKEALAEVLGDPSSVEESRRLGRSAVVALLWLARRCPGAVLDSTWFPYARRLVLALPGPVVEVRCRVPVDVARARYTARAAARADVRRDLERDDEELWGNEVAPLGVGPLVEVDTSGPVDRAALARAVLAAV